MRIGKFVRGARRTESAITTAVPGDTVAAMSDGQTKLAGELVAGDVVVVEAGGLIPCDGTVIEGMAMVDESAITGESAPVLRERGTGREAVVAGTRVLTSRIVIRV